MAENSAIDALLARLKPAATASSGPATVNPSVAPQVIDTATRAEVTAQPPATPAPTAAYVPPTRPLAAAAIEEKIQLDEAKRAAEQKTRRTAAVVQQELDAALAEIAAFKAQLAAGGSAAKLDLETALAYVRKALPKGTELKFWAGEDQ